MLISELGVDYAGDTLYGTFMMYNGKPYKITGVSYSQLSLLNTEDDSVTTAPSSVLTGWKGLKFPRLGYRRLPAGPWGYMRRRPRSYSRGLNSDNLLFTFSKFCSHNNCSEEVYREHPFDVETQTDSDYDGDVWERRNNMILRTAFLPQYDKPEMLEKVLAGEELSFIPNSRTLVEPSLNKDGHFSVFIDDGFAGSIDKDGKVYAPAKNQKIIATMVNRYGA